MPSLDEFFAEAIEQADPANMVEDEYKYVPLFQSQFGRFLPTRWPLASLLVGLCICLCDFSDSPCKSTQGCSEPKLWLACSEAAVQEKSPLLSTDQSEVQEPGRLPGQHG